MTFFLFEPPTFAKIAQTLEAAQRWLNARYSRRYGGNVLRGEFSNNARNGDDGTAPPPEPPRCRNFHPATQEAVARQENKTRCQRTALHTFNCIAARLSPGVRCINRFDHHADVGLEGITSKTASGAQCKQMGPQVSLSDTRAAIVKLPTNAGLQCIPGVLSSCANKRWVPCKCRVDVQQSMIE